MTYEEKLEIGKSDNAILAAIQILDRRVSLLEGAERSGAAQRSAPSTSCSAPARSVGAEQPLINSPRSAPWSGLVRRPDVVCLCGSMRFIQQFNDLRKILTYEHKIVLSPEVVKSDLYLKDTDFQKKLRSALNELQLRRIDISNFVLVVNVKGYIGESTRREIQYAKDIGKPIRYLEPEPDSGQRSGQKATISLRGKKGKRATARNDGTEPPPPRQQKL